MTTDELSTVFVALIAVGSLLATLFVLAALAVSKSEEDE
jgi:hypothetical protein